MYNICFDAGTNIIGKACAPSQQLPKAWMKPPIMVHSPYTQAYVVLFVLHVAGSDIAA